MAPKRSTQSQEAKERTLGRASATAIEPVAPVEYGHFVNGIPRRMQLPEAQEMFTDRVDVAVMCAEIIDDVIDRTGPDISRVAVDNVAMPAAVQDVLTSAIEALAMVFAPREHVDPMVALNGFALPASGAAQVQQRASDASSATGGGRLRSIDGLQHVVSIPDPAEAGGSICPDAMVIDIPEPGLIAADSWCRATVQQRRAIASPTKQASNVAAQPSRYRLRSTVGPGALASPASSPGAASASAGFIAPAALRPASGSVVEDGPPPPGIQLMRDDSRPVSPMAASAARDARSSTDAHIAAGGLAAEPAELGGTQGPPRSLQSTQPGAPSGSRRSSTGTGRPDAAPGRPRSTRSSTSAAGSGSTSLRRGGPGADRRRDDKSRKDKKTKDAKTDDGVGADEHETCSDGAVHVEEVVAAQVQYMDRLRRTAETVDTQLDSLTAVKQSDRPGRRTPALFSDKKDPAFTIDHATGVVVPVKTVTEKTGRVERKAEGPKKDTKRQPPAPAGTSLQHPTPEFHTGDTPPPSDDEEDETIVRALSPAQLRRLQRQAGGPSATNAAIAAMAKQEGLVDLTAGGSQASASQPPSRPGSRLTASRVTTPGIGSRGNSALGGKRADKDAAPPAEKPETVTASDGTIVVIGGRKRLPSVLFCTPDERSAPMVTALKPVGGVTSVDEEHGISKAELTLPKQRMTRQELSKVQKDQRGDRNPGLAVQEEMAAPAPLVQSAPPSGVESSAATADNRSDIDSRPSTAALAAAGKKRSIASAGRRGVPRGGSASATGRPPAGPSAVGAPITADPVGVVRVNATPPVTAALAGVHFAIGRPSPLPSRAATPGVGTSTKYGTSAPVFARRRQQAPSGDEDEEEEEAPHVGRRRPKPRGGVTLPPPHNRTTSTPNPAMRRRLPPSIVANAAKYADMDTSVATAGRHEETEDLFPPPPAGHGRKSRVTTGGHTYDDFADI